MRLELPVIRVQVQLDHMKPGLPPRRRYEPGILRQVASLRLTPDGAVGLDADGTERIDVHNVKHSHTRNSKGRNGISIMTTGDYAALRAVYGPHITDGIAGESLLLDYAEGLARRAMPDELTIAENRVIHSDLNRVIHGDTDSATHSPGKTGRAELVLTGVHVAKPCVEFTRFCLRRADFDVDDAIRQGLANLDNGARGYKMSAATCAVIRPGDIVVFELPD
ncbi:MAG: hypothetical protein ABI382_12490 [Nakamurella sp.]